jgi:hypothetical protein
VTVEPEVSPEDDPLAYLERAIHREVARLENRRAELAGAGEALLRLNAQIHAFAFSPKFDVGIEPVAPGMIAAMIEGAARRADDIVRTCAVSLEEGPGLDEHNVRIGQDRVTTGLRQRALYLETLLESESGRQWVRNWAEAGEEQRVTTVPLSDFAVFDDKGVFAVSTWGDPSSPYVFIRHPMLVRAFIALFDSAWEAALPVGGGLGPKTSREEDDRLLDLMSMGVKDEAIARHLGWSLRTVRRRVAGLMVEYGVDTRFQLGVAVGGSDRLHGAAPRPR